MIRAIILAAGRGSRLGKITKESHKSLIKFKKTNLLKNICKNLEENQINKISIITGYKKNLFKNYNLKKFHNKHWKSTNMVYSLSKADTWLCKYTCIVSYSDIYYDSSAIKLLLKTKNNFVILNNKNWLNNWKSRYKNPLKDAESFKINKENYLIEIGKKEKSIKNIQGQYMGLFKITPKTWKKIKKKIPYVLEKNNISITELINRLIKLNFKIMINNYHSKWFEIDNKRDLKFFLKSIND